MSTTKIPNSNIESILSQSKDILCDCGNATFIEVFLIKHISALVSPDGKETIAPIPTMACNACGKVHPVFMPQYMKDALSNNIKSSTIAGDGKPKLSLI